MAEIKEYLDLQGLTHAVEKIKGYTDGKDAETLKSAKDYADGLSTNYDAAGTATTKVKELEDGQVKTNKEAIEVLNGDESTVGSVAKALKDAKTELEGKIKASAYNDLELKGKITAVEADITTLKGTGEGSVKKQIDDAFNDFSTKVSDDDVVNTYKELIDYAAAHKGEAATMAGDISKNAEAIKTLETYVGKLPEGTDAKTVIDYINKKIEGTDQSSAIEQAKQAAIKAAATDATTKASNAEKNAKSYADGLAKNYATAAQGTKADSAVQSVKIGTKEYKSGTTVTLPAYPTTLPASDVKAWAKAATKPTYTKAEVGLDNVDNTADANKSVKYATSAGSANSATTASKLKTNAGSATQPVYFANGVPVACNVSTDYLAQGSNTLILNCGNAS